MKKFAILLAFVLSFSLISGCASSGSKDSVQVAATTLPVFDFTQRLCEGTDITVTRLVTEQVSCLHDYSLNVQQVRSAESAEVIVVSGAGLEDFLTDILDSSKVIDASSGIELLCHHHSHSHESHGHIHEQDPHIWLSPVNASIMAENICDGLIRQYPEYEEVLAANLQILQNDLGVLQQYGQDQLQDLSCRELVTFHDGFSYFAQAFDLTILQSVEEESGSEASAQDLTGLIQLVSEHQLPAVFTEKNGSTSAAAVISGETGAQVYSLDMAMSGDSYFDSMYSNIDTIKEALG